MPRVVRVYKKKVVPPRKPLCPKQYILLDVDTLNDSLKNIRAKCSNCSRTNLRYEVVSLVGLGCTIKLSCSSYPEMSITFDNSKKTGILFNVNIQFVYAVRCIGKGRIPVETFCEVMNLPSPPMRFNPYQQKILKAVEETAVESMNRWLADAVQKESDEKIHLARPTNMDMETSDEEADTILNITVAFDGTWQKRGHTSKNGVVCATSVINNKVIDVQEFSQFCRCEDKQSHKSNCEAFPSNSGAMEVEGVKMIFSRSVDRNVRYTKFLGDGDSRAFDAVCEMKPYGDAVKVKKLECVGHVQKRMGTRLRKLKKVEKLTGKHGITDAQINHIQRCYGLAIRQNTKSVDSMKTAIWALYHHMMDDHAKCPKNSWCKFHNTGEPKKNPVPKDIMLKTYPTFEELTADHLLKRCLHGGTQNSNESFNNVLWSRIPKRVFVQWSTLKLGIYDAVLTYNDGLAARGNVLRKLHITQSSKLLAPKPMEKERQKKKELQTNNNKKNVSLEPHCSKFIRRALIP